MLPRLCIVGSNACLCGRNGDTGDVGALASAPGVTGDKPNDEFEAGGGLATFAATVSTTSIVDFGRNPNRLVRVPVTERRKLLIERDGRAVGGGFYAQQKKHERGR